MEFLDEEIALAKRLRELGLPWEPSVGNYVWDENNSCKQPSPFQTGVYFILNYAYFMRMVGGLERFKEIMIWLPTWSDLRSILREFGCKDEWVAKHIQESKAIESGKERVVLYELALAELKKRTSKSVPAI